jgi:YgiT-type zinc finger domain-containing protein
MATDTQDLQAEDFVEQRVRYSIDLGDRFVVVENVPARVSVRSGEQFFSPETTERLWRIVHGGGPPTRVMEATVYEYR